MILAVEDTGKRDEVLVLIDWESMVSLTDLNVMFSWLSISENAR